MTQLANESIVTWRTQKPAPTQDRSQWAEEGYKLAEQLAEKGFGQEAFNLIETDLWEVANFSATASWGITRQR